MNTVGRNFTIRGNNNDPQSVVASDLFVSCDPISVVSDDVQIRKVVNFRDTFSVLSDLNPFARSFHPSHLISSSEFLAEPTPNINIISAPRPPEMKEIVSRLNPLAPCFKPFSMAGDGNCMFGNTLNPNAPTFFTTNSVESEGSENSSASPMDTTPLIVETGTPDVSLEMFSDDDLELLTCLSDNDSVSEFIEQEPNHADLSSYQVTSTAPSEAVIDQESPKNVLKSLRQKNIDRIIIGSLNVNSIPNKIELLGDLIRGQVDIFLVIETKLNKSFPPSQFT